MSCSIYIINPELDNQLGKGLIVINLFSIAQSRLRRSAHARGAGLKGPLLSIYARCIWQEITASVPSLVDYMTSGLVFRTQPMCDAQSRVWDLSSWCV